ncbi:zinc ribbon domain-containing protein [Nocardioides jejuensis]|uniref:zinc ribbon domain-containing protein n=1 Tax=Nocardioides jejuensis TaxID=2502782 RepID=UPI001FB499DB|nr:C4-type zinc ribbon domain-containing protein [Nocardioides jejuensis]
MKADPAIQAQLLDVADLDARISQLTHQLKTLPEIAELATLAAEESERTNRMRDAKIRVDDLTKEQKKADADVEQVKARRERDRSRLEQGLITDPKQIQAMSHELESLERRIGVLEDEELEVMEMLEAAQMELTKAEAAVGESVEQREVLEARRLEKSVSVERELDGAQRRRAEAVVGVDAPLLALYDRLHASRGIGAGALRARTCGGCQLTLNPGDLAELAKAPLDEVLRCPECERILVRTSESGI